MQVRGDVFALNASGGLESFQSKFFFPFRLCGDFELGLVRGWSFALALFWV